MTITLPTKTGEEAPEVTTEEKPDVHADDGAEVLPEAPAAEAPAAEKPAEDDRVRKLEIELAEMRGRESARKEEPKAPAVDPQEAQYQQTKQLVLNEAAALDDESFAEKYKMSKADARIHFMSVDLERSKIRQSEETASLSAENRLLAKYGKDYADQREELRSAIADAAPEVRQNADRLEKYLERQFKAIAPETKPAPAAKKEPTVTRRVIDPGFVPPSATPSPSERPALSKGDEIAAEDRKLAEAFGLTSEKERRELAETPFVEVRFRNTRMTPKGKGWERIAK
jgi:hypothetical protein